MVIGKGLGFPPRNVNPLKCLPHTDMFFFFHTKYTLGYLFGDLTFRDKKGAMMFSSSRNIPLFHTKQKLAEFPFKRY